MTGSAARGGGALRPEHPGRLGPVFAAIWLFYLADPLLAGWRERGTVAGVVGIVATVVFATLYLRGWMLVRADRDRMLTSPPLPEALRHLAVLGAVGAVMVVSLGEVGMASVVYVAVAGAIWLPWQRALVLTAGLLVLTLGLGALEHWDSQAGVAFGLMAATAAMTGMRALVRRNAELLVAEQENARLAVENERTRFARDLHDILGHSLTVVTVKAELAGRLLESDDPAALVRARAEVADLERLSRDALADVRRAVAGYRDLTLPGELARARAALEAAEIDADLPNSTEDVPSDLRELFAWTVREGVTNVIRHSGARTCRIRLLPDAVEVSDDGTGRAEPAWRAAGDAAAGAGLAGLRERASAVGAVVVTRVLDPGFALEVRR